MSEMEKLAEEIKAIADKWAWASISYPDDIEMEDIPAIQVKTGIDERGILPIIECIGKTYAEGMPLPGEVGRDIMARFVADAFDEGIAMEGSLRYDLKAGDTIIALRKEKEAGNNESPSLTQ